MNQAQRNYWEMEQVADASNGFGFKNFRKRKCTGLYPMKLEDKNDCR